MSMLLRFGLVEGGGQITIESQLIKYCGLPAIRAPDTLIASPTEVDS